LFNFLDMKEAAEDIQYKLLIIALNLRCKGYCHETGEACRWFQWTDIQYSSIQDIAGKYYLLILKQSSYLKLNIFVP
jgi:hypothetical protein